LLVTGLWLAAISPVHAESQRVLTEWKFGTATQWNGWTPNAAIKDAKFDDAGVSFDSTGSDPILTGPRFEAIPATNNQWVVIDIDCPRSGGAELFYTNKTTGGYSGFESNWVQHVMVPGAGRQSVTVWPSWASLGKVIQVRFDPPSGMRCKLYAIRVVEMVGNGPKPAWKFGPAEDSWCAMYGAALSRSADGLVVQAATPQAMIVSPVEPFDAAAQSILKLEAVCPGEQSINLYWATKEDQGFFGGAMTLQPGACDDAMDLRQFSEWKGTITHLAIAFGTKGKEVLTLKSLAIAPNDSSRPFVRSRLFNFEHGLARPGQDVNVRLILEHAGGPALSACRAQVKVSEQATCAVSSLDVPALTPGQRVDLRLPIRTEGFGLAAVGLSLPNGQNFTKVFALSNAVAPELLKQTDGYDVPVPKPAQTDYQIGIYYFPGWSPDQLSRWQKQDGFPERDSLLGWYEEGRPEVADWHIKWAVENGISFFVYDWYWSHGKEQLTAGLNDGFLKARYNEMMKFAIMWANHGGFSDHTPDQLLQVTDYWIEHYFRKPNCLKVDGKPYVSFFSPHELLRCLGSEEKVRASFDAMRERAKQAGLPGIHFGACAGGDQAFNASLKRAGFDSLTGYNYRRLGSSMKQAPYLGYLLAHESIWKMNQAPDAIKYIPLLTVGWDSRPWDGPRAEAQFDRSPAGFRAGLQQLKANLDSTGGKMAILEAWNEWGEGSYIEPNVEYGFGDVEAIRSVFCGGNGPTNIGPDDVGLAGKYDLRCKVNLAGKNPSIRSGMELICRNDRVALTAGKYVMNGKEYDSPAGVVPVTPAEIVEIKDMPMTLTAEAAQTWHLGNRLIISEKDRRNILPDSYVVDSLRIRDPNRPDVEFTCPRDYVIDNQWGAFTLAKDGRLKGGDKVTVTYKYSTRRVDALVLSEPEVQARESTKRAKLTLIKGTPSADCPDLPTVPSGVFHVANVYRPYNAREVTPVQIYPIGTPPKREAKVENAAALQPFVKKLQTGEPATIVFWGDSVTACGESSSPATCYVGLTESMLKQRFAKANLKVVNASIGGTSTPGRFPNYQKEVLDFHPDVVTLEFVNDMGIPVDQMQQRYTEILKRTREAGAVLVLITPHFTRPDWIGLPPGGRGDDPRPNVAFLRRFAHDNNLPLADASRRWADLEYVGVPYEILLRNGINHPEDRGHRFFAEELLRLFEAAAETLPQ
jgi:lysophospholipase L1-like esterase